LQTGALLICAVPAPLEPPVAVFGGFIGLAAPPNCGAPPVSVTCCRFSIAAVQGAFAGTSTTMAGSPTVQESRKNSSYLQSGQPPIGPTPMRLARISAPMPAAP
jgi:hypothetical protein